jgi:hypothetical protein
MKKYQLALLTLLLLTASLCWGQSSNQGAIVGTITDINAGVVPSVQIIVLNVETGSSRTVTTDERGNYRVDFLPPAAYTFSAALKGFKTTKGGVTVHVSEVQRVDLQLAPEGISETVEVNSDASALINTDTPTLGQVINERSIQNLPLNGREFLGLAGLVPGAQTDNNKRGAVASKGITVGFNGARSNYNAYYVDGADSTDVVRNQLISSPPLDAVKEFRVDANLYSAKYGRAGGAIISVVTKSGTNNFHGSLYEYHRDKWLDAAPVFDTRPYALRPPYLLNQFGGSIGGPVTFPKFGEGGPALKSLRNKTFFFFSAEFFRSKKPGQLAVSFAPTDLERSGDFSQSINPFTGQKMVLRNPFTGQVIPSGIIPPELINPVGKKLMDLLPRPNYAGDPILNLHLFRSGTYRQNKWLARVDHNFSSKSNVSFSYDFSDYDNSLLGNTIYGDKDDLQHDRTLVASYTQTLAPNLVNDFKFNHTSFDLGQKFLLSDKNYAKEWGLWTGTTQNPDILGSPRILLYTVGFQVFQIGAAGPDYYQNQHTYVRDDLVWVKGAHSISMGADFKRQAYNRFINDSSLGSYYFGILDGDPTQVATYGVTGSAFASLLMGVTPRTTYDLSKAQGLRFRRNLFGLYVQDDWKVSPRLTLNLGLRYDYEAPFAEIDNKLLTLDYATGMPRYAKGAPADLLALMKFPYETNGPNRPYEPSKTDFSPRFGFAFRPFNDNKTAVRGGYGIAYISQDAQYATYQAWVLPFSGDFDYYSKAFNWPDNQNHFVTIDQQPYNFYAKVGTTPGIWYSTDPYYPSSYMQQWNLSASRDVGWGVAVEAGYVGSRGVNLNGIATFTALYPALYAKVKQDVPALGAIGLWTKGFNSKFHALELKANKRLSGGLEFLAAFTWGHTLAESSNEDSNENNYVDPTQFGQLFRRAWSNADFDVSKRFTLSGSYQLPIGRGKSLGRNWSAVADSILGGWRLSYIVTLQDGFPFSVRTASNTIPDRICDGNLPASQRTTARWFDTKCFVTHVGQPFTNPNGVITTINTTGNAAANIITGPPLKRVDMGLHKEFSLTEKAKLQLRLETFNLFNHPNFIGPSANYFLNTPTGGRITRTFDNRDIQLAIKLLF